MTHLETASSCVPARRFSILAMLVQMHGLARQRRALAGLDRRLRDDVGINANDAKREANRPFWDAPSHW